MPNEKLYNALMERLEKVNKQLQTHLAEGVGVKKDIEWLKRGMQALMCLVGSLLVVLVGALVTYVLK